MVEDFAAARAAGLRLGWTPGWVDTVLGECLAVLLAWHGGTVADLNERGGRTSSTSSWARRCTLSRSSLRAYRARLASLRQLLFEIGVHDQPPRRRPWSRTLEQRFAEVAMAEPIRTVLLRYVQTRASVLRPRSVESLVNDLLPFAEFLTAHHPEVTSLRDLQRSHVEEFLIWNRTRPWRGRKARPQPVSAAVAQSAVLSLRNLLEDIAAWGWAEAPDRAAGVRRRRSQARPGTATRPDPGRRRKADGRRRRLAGPVRPDRSAGAARHRPAGR